MNFRDLLEMEGLKADNFRLIRHGNKEIDPLHTYKNRPELFEAYQAFQKKDKFGEASHLATFVPHHGTHALFLGIWEIENWRPASEAPKEALDLIKRFNWNLQNNTFYSLIKSDALSDLSERLIIDWGKATISWVQRKTDKSVFSILPPAHICEFESYERTILKWKQLEKLVKNPSGNTTWYDALRHVNGIYCITDNKTGKLYVGSAYGKDGIWGRWSAYAKNRHGGNKKMVELLKNDPDAVCHFQYTILEILPGSSTADDAIEKENLWKNKLRSREHGYNM